MEINTKIKMRQWENLPWRDPRTDLVNLGRLQARIAASTGISPTVADLREKELRKYLEWRQAALFCYFISQAVLDAPIAYSLLEDEDFDCLAQWVHDDRRHFFQIQLKEVAPKKLNPKAELNDELSKLKKYVTSNQTIVAIHLNQSGRIEFSDIEVPTCGLSEIWLYGSLTPDQSRWFLYGNLLANPKGHEIGYPT